MLAALLIAGCGGEPDAGAPTTDEETGEPADDDDTGEPSEGDSGEAGSGGDTGGDPLDTADPLPDGPSPDAVLLGTGWCDGLGSDLAVADVDGDGRDDLVVGAEGGAQESPGAVYAFAPVEAGVTTRDDAWLGLGAAAYDAAGSAVAAVGDVDGDGCVDLVVGAEGVDAEGEAYLLTGCPAGTGSLVERASALIAPPSDGRLGVDTSPAGDQDGDGVPDLLVGDPHHGEDEGDTLEYPGAIAVLSGTVRGAVTSDAGLAWIEGEGPRCMLGYYVAGGVDADGDGVADVLAYALCGEGALHVFRGPVRGELGLADADAVWANTADEQLGGDLRFVGDHDGDGLEDLMVRGDFGDRGGAYLLSPRADGAFAPADTFARIEGDTVGHHVGKTVAGGGDLDGDGHPDVVLSGAYAEPEGVWVYRGPLAGTRALADADVVLTGAESFGASASIDGDLDGDGRAELVVGAWAYEGADVNTGAVYVWFDVLAP
jgi:hypothetical protein